MQATRGKGSAERKDDANLFSLTQFDQSRSLSQAECKLKKVGGKRPMPDLAPYHFKSLQVTIRWDNTAHIRVLVSLLSRFLKPIIWKIYVTF